MSTHGAALVAALGIGHTTAYVVGMIVLGVGCRRRSGHSIVPRPCFRSRSTISAGVVSGVAWVAMRALDPSGRLQTLVCLALVGGIGSGRLRRGRHDVGGALRTVIASEI